MKGRALLLVLSVLVAAVGTGLVYAYVRGADNRAAKGQDTVEIAIAQKKIPVGTSASDVAEQFLDFRQVSQSTMVPGAVTRAGVARLQKMTTSRAIAAIDKSTPVLWSFFQDSSSGSASSTGDPQNVSIQVEIEGAAAGVGLLQVGQPVIVFVTIKSGSLRKTKVLLPKATVNSINAVTGADEGNASGRGAQTPDGGQGTVGLSVPMADAEKVIFANEFKDRFSLYFGLPGTSTPLKGKLDEATAADLTSAVNG